METEKVIGLLLNRIQEACRSYPTQSDGERKMTFATIRTTADTIAAVCEGELASRTADEVRNQVNVITASLDELGNLWGGDDADSCQACGARLVSAKLGEGRLLRYCVRCPSDILEAVRTISDLTGADTL